MRRLVLDSGPDSVLDSGAAAMLLSNLAVLALAATAGCAPTFDAQGSLSINGEPFEPVSCRVLAGTKGGIELTDKRGARLSLALPPAHLNAWREISGVPQVSYDPGAGERPIDLGRCGSVTLRGEGYHGQGKRAANGHLELACSGAVSIKGELRWTGCF
ncbi:MAG: hypothetical protein WCI05_13555 [Myxococcales bacterium]